MDCVVSYARFFWRRSASKRAMPRRGIRGPDSQSVGYRPDSPAGGSILRSIVLLARRSLLSLWSPHFGTWPGIAAGGGRGGESLNSDRQRTAPEPGAVAHTRESAAHEFRCMTNPGSMDGSGGIHFHAMRWH